MVEPGQPVPKGGGVYRVGKPYQVAGRTYTPEENARYRNEGLASWYGDDFHGRLTANGEVYDMEAISAAHPTMPMPSYVRVTNLNTRKSLIVRVNDRGPYHANREIDLSATAADLLGFRGHGIARVRVEYVGPAPLQGTDDRQLIATLREGSPAPAPAGVMMASNRFLPNFGRPPSRSARRCRRSGPTISANATAASRSKLSADAHRGGRYARARERGARAPSRSPRSPMSRPTPSRRAYMRSRAARPWKPRPSGRADAARVPDPCRRRAAPGRAQPPAASPVTAYAPVARTASQAVSTGRGLY